MATTDYTYKYLERREMLPFVPDGCTKILEVGCGDGSFAAQLAVKPGLEVWGVEMHKASALVASGKLHRVLAGEFEPMIDSQLPGNYFDCIIFNDVLEHFPYTDKVLMKIRKLLSAQGYVVASIPNFRYVGNLWEIVVNKDFDYKDSGILDYTHFRFFTQKSIRRMFSHAGYEVLKCEGINGTNSINVKILNLMTFNFFSDIRFMQIGVQARLMQ